MLDAILHNHLGLQVQCYEGALVLLLCSGLLRVQGSFEFIVREGTGESMRKLHALPAGLHLESREES